jgi:hypothetical protein
MQNITAARLLPGFLRPAAGEWCAPLFLGQASGWVSGLRFVAAWVGFGVRERGLAELGWDWLWALPPIRPVMEYLPSPRQSHVSVSFKVRRKMAIAGSRTRTVGLQNTSDNNFIG